jgi:mRNA deadenylase 3'-5' endonuclease subunit Ccr4
MNEHCSILDDFGCVAYEEASTEDDEDKTPGRLIRIQADSDECLADIHSREDVWRKIREVRDSQSEYGRADLYERRWKSQSSDGANKDRPSINGDLKESTETKHSFSVMQFNTLAEGLSSGPSVKTPFPCGSALDKNSAKNCYGGFTTIRHTEVALDFDMRRWRLLEVMLSSSSGLSTPPFDIIALEEVDRFGGFFAPVLKKFGYQAIFAPKIRAPGVHLGFYSDGCALFWKENVFDIASECRMNYRGGNQVYIIATLRHKQSDRHLVVAVTHLKAQKGEKNEEARRKQIAELLEKLDEERQRIKAGSEDIPVLILGDFNAEPPSSNVDDSCVGLVLDHHKISGSSEFHSAYPIDPSQPGYFTKWPKRGVETVKRMIGSIFRSPIDLSQPGYFTTWKTRGTETVKRVIDYIFYSNMTCTDTLDIPDEACIEADQLPGLRYPSDHLMIAAKFKL